MIEYVVLLFISAVGIVFWLKVNQVALLITTTEEIVFIVDFAL